MALNCISRSIDRLNSRGAYCPTDNDAHEGRTPPSVTNSMSCVRSVSISSQSRRLFVGHLRLGEGRGPLTPRQLGNLTLSEIAPRQSNAARRMRTIIAKLCFCIGQGTKRHRKIYQKQKAKKIREQARDPCHIYKNET